MRIRQIVCVFGAVLVCAAALPFVSTGVRAQPGAQSLMFVGSELSQDDLLKHARAAAIVGIRPVGSTSVAFAMRLRGGVDASFKPRQQKKPLGYRAEIAAYRLARLLELDNVPPVVSRLVPLATIREKLDPEFSAAVDEFAAAMIADPSVNGPTVPGAATYWIPSLKNLGLDSSRRMERWTRHLKQSGSIHEQEMSWHRDLSNMLVFDYITGNSDRWSGSNVQGTPDGSRLYIRDNDLAFPETLRPERHRALLDSLQRTEKFSRRLVARLRALTESSLRAELAKDPRSAVEPILSSGQILGALDRRDAVISYVDALVEEYGADRVFVFE